MWQKHRIAILSITLLVSLALNVAFLAWVGGQRTGEYGPRSYSTQSLAKALESLPADKRDTAEDIIKKYRDESRKEFSAAREQRRVIRTMLNEQSPNPEKVKAAFAEMRAHFGKAQQLNQEMLVELLPYIPPESRHLLLSRPKRDDHKKPGRTKDDAPPP